MNFTNQARKVSTITVLAGLALGIAAVLAPHARGAGGSAAVGAQHIAVANVSRIFNQMQETKDLKEKLEAKQQELTTQGKEKQAAIKEMGDSLHNLKPDSPQFKDKVGDLDKAMADFDAWTKVVRLQGERDQKQTMRSLFEKIRAAVADVAKQQGYDLVIADQSGEFPNLEQVNFDQLRGYINQQNVLFAAKGIDISETVLTLLDAQYAKEKGTK